MGQTVNLLAYAFGGSNPSLPTIRAVSYTHLDVYKRQAVGKRIVSSSLIFIIGECLLIHCLYLIFYKSTDIS